MQVKLLFLHALSPLHVGTGQGVGVIDLPVAREKPTGIPIVPGSSLKGVLRSAVEDDDLRKRVFGPDTDAAHEYAGSLQFSDLRLLFLPVRSLRGTFAWVTSPYLLQRYLRDIEWVQKSLPLPQLPQVAFEDQCIVSDQPQSALTFSQNDTNQVVLEDLDLAATSDETFAQWAKSLAPQIFSDATWQQHFKERGCLVHDDILSFLLDTALEVTARIRLKEETKTVERRALWYEEALPAESIMAGLVVINLVRASEEEILNVLQQMTQNPLQLGGAATIGRGFCRLTLL